MTPKATYIAIAAAFVAAMVLGRYEMTPASSEVVSAYVLDRWTGHIQLVVRDKIHPVVPRERQPLLNDSEVFGK